LHTAARFEQYDQSTRQISAAALRTAEGCDVDYRKRAHSSSVLAEFKKALATSRRWKDRAMKNRLSIGPHGHREQTILENIDQLSRHVSGLQCEEDRICHYSASTISGLIHLFWYLLYPKT
jgi:hypothetical protein